MPKYFVTPRKVLTKAIVIASLSVASFTVLSTSAAIKMDSAEKAVLVEQRLAHINKQFDILLDRLTVIPVIWDVSLKYSKLAHDESNQSATSQGVLTLVVDEDELNIDEIVFALDKSIDYSEAINQEDILARATTDISFKEDTRAYRELVPDQREIMSAFLQKIEMRTDLLAGSAFKQYLTIPDIYSAGTEDDPELDFGGLKIQASFDENNFIEGVGDLHFDVKQLSFSQMREEIDYDALMALSQEEQANLAYEDYPMSKEMVKELDIQPFTLDFGLSEDGKINLDSSPIAISVENNNYSLLIERLSGNGKVSYDEDIKKYTGSQAYSAHNVLIDSIELPEPITFKSMEYMQNLNRSGDTYDMEGQVLLVPDENSLSMLTDGMFNIDSIDWRFYLENFSQDAFEQLGNLQSLAASEDLDINDDNRALVQSLINSLTNEGASLGMEFMLNTDQGEAYMVSTLHLREGANAQAWTDALTTENEQALENLANQDLFYKVEVAVPISLLDAVGMTGMAEMMGAPYIVKQNGYFIVRVQNKGNGPLINGKTIEELEAGM